MSEGSVCAHLNVIWCTESKPGGYTRGWWQCLTCPMIFAPTPAPDATGLRDSDSLLASATDLLNSWARESSVREAETPEDIVGVIDRLWSALSVRLHATPAQPSRAQMDLQSTDAYEVGFSNGQAAMTKKSRAQIVEECAKILDAEADSAEALMSSGEGTKLGIAIARTVMATDRVNAYRIRALAAQPTPEQEGK